MQTAAPSGTLTFVFTDIEGSTRRWEQNPHEMREQLARHDELVRAVLERSGGFVFKTVGDAFCCAFADPHDALAAAAALEREIGEVEWGAAGELRVRVAVHTGAVEARDGDYFGPPLNRVARLLAIARGGQVLVSDATERLTRDRLPPAVTLVDLGQWSLRDISAPVQVYQLSFPGMLPLFASPSAHAFVPNNLPQELSTFVGRKAELHRVKKMLQNSRLVSIVGPGGVGKTRLALRAGTDLCGEFPGGVWFVELGEHPSDADVGAAVAKAMCISASGRNTVAAIAQQIGTQRSLVVLDNSERFIEGCSDFVKALLRISGSVRFLVTTHQPLHVEGEQIFTLEPLPIPEPWMALEDLKRSDAAKLFVERARAAERAFKLSEENRADVIAICRRLEGIPLAVELAAARAHTLSLKQILARLNERFALLTGGNAGVGHHRALRSTIDWSYELLTGAERAFFARLGIIRATFTLEAAEAVCSGAPIVQAAIVDLLQQLVEKSFLTSAGGADARRFRMLDTIRVYAEERLAAAGQRAPLEELHFRYFQQSILQLQDASGRQQTLAIDAVEQSHADVLAALDWAGVHRNADVPKLVLAMVPFWMIRGYLQEGAVRVEAVANTRNADDVTGVELFVHASSLRNAGGEPEAARADAEAAVQLCARLSDDRAVADARCALAGVLANSGSYAQARDMFDAAFTIYERNNETRGCMRVLINAGLMHTALGEFESARVLLGRASELAPLVQDTRLHAWTCGALGNVEQQSGNFAEAQSQYELCLGMCRATGDKSLIAITLNHLAEVALLLENAEQARAFAEESLNIAEEHGLLLQMGDALEAVARLMALREADVVAAQLFGAVDDLRSRTSFPFTEPEQRTREEAMRFVRDRHPCGWFESEQAQGAAKTLESSIRLARTSLRTLRH